MGDNGLVRLDARQDRYALEPRNVDEAWRIAEIAVKSRLYGVSTIEQAFAIVQTGRELGITATQALRGIYVVEGKPFISADLAVALVKNSGECEFWVTRESTAELCTIETRRRGEPVAAALTYTIEDAARAFGGLRGNYVKIPRVMLRHRCALDLAREVYPHLLLGLYVEAEFHQGAVIEGEVIEETTPRSEAYTAALGALPSGPTVTAEMLHAAYVAGLRDLDTDEASALFGACLDRCPDGKRTAFRRLEQARARLEREAKQRAAQTPVASAESGSEGEAAAQGDGPLAAFQEDLAQIELPSESVVVWLKHRAGIAQLTQAEREGAWKALCKRTEGVGRMKGDVARKWLKRAIAEEDERKVNEGAKPERARWEEALESYRADVARAHFAHEVPTILADYAAQLGELGPGLAFDAGLERMVALGSPDAAARAALKAALAPKPKPPTGTDAPRGSATDTAGSGEHVAATEGAPAAQQERVAQAKGVVLTVVSAPDYAADAPAWRAHVAAILAPRPDRTEAQQEKDRLGAELHLVNSLAKHRERFERCGVWTQRLSAAAIAFCEARECDYSVALEGLRLRLRGKVAA